MGILNQIQSCVKNALFYLTEHAQLEAENDDLDIFDIENCLLFGRIRKVWPTEMKYEIIGKSLDGRNMGVVCRLTQGRKVRVITVYEDKTK